MSSLLTNMSAMSALQNLAATQKSLNDTQNQISSGLRVATASDNAAYWSISTVMKSDTSALSAVSDALNLGSSTLGTATAAINSTLSILNKMKADLVTAQTPGTDLGQIQSDIAAQQSSLKSIASSASFNGVNLLDGTQGGTISFAASFSRTTSGTTTLGTIGLDTSLTALTGTSGILTGSAGLNAGTAGGGTNLTTFTIGASTSTSSLATIATDIDLAIKSVTAAGAKLGAAQTTINTQSTFVSTLSDAITAGVGSLVDADMNVASTRLQALQTQQQLGIQSLSIANQNASLILKLFG